EWPGAENEVSKVIKARVIAFDGTSLSNEWIDWIRLLNWPDGAEYVSDNIPAKMYPGEKGTFEIRMRNVGSADWSESTKHSIEIVGAFAEKSRFVYLASGERIASGDVWTARVPLEAPIIPGRYRTRWIMNHTDVAWFGPIVERTISIAKGMK
ncbi:MAG: hypothetical protein WCL39_06245, partial [Armatimonadota bacterium]